MLCITAFMCKSDKDGKLAIIFISAKYKIRVLYQIIPMFGLWI